jgi:hypothetical protein
MTDISEPAEGRVGAIRAELIGDRNAIAAGVTAHGRAPVLELCRRLVASGHDAHLQLEAYRGDVLALTVKSIGVGAKLTVDESHGCRFVRFRGEGQQTPDLASPMRQTGPGLVKVPSAGTQQ